MRYKIAAVVIMAGFAFIPYARSVTIAGGRIVEDFSDATYADFAATTGLWNIVSHRAQAAIAANGKEISFGDGSLGDLTWTAGQLTFDTNASPNGFNYRSISITGGTIKVQGANTLILRSLTTVNITPALSVAGGNGANGGFGAGLLAAPNGGAGIASKSVGGAGGAANPAGTNGGDGLDATGAVDGTGGALNNGGSASDGNAPATAPGLPNTFETGGFVAGGGGGGGGGQSTGGIAPHATGGAGGAGGGTLRIASVGTLTVGVTDASGGNGGNGAVDNGGACGGGHDSGNGAGANPGAVWLQAGNTLTAPAPTLNFGAAGSTGCVTGSAGNPFGQFRADAPATAGGIGAAAFDTTNALANKSYIVVSKAYDLNTLNAGFTNAATYVSSTPGGGSVSVDFAGSKDGTNFSPYMSDIRTLSDQSYRYVKFRVTVNTAGIAAASPFVSQVAWDYQDMGLDKLDLKISAGCGTITNTGDGKRPNTKTLATWFGGWAIFWLVAYALMRRRHWVVRATAALVMK